MSPILRDVRNEIENLNLKTNRRMQAFDRFVKKLTTQLGHEPTDADLRALGRAGLMRLETNDAERNVAGKIARRMEQGSNA
jgi:hypothetical protein